MPLESAIVPDGTRMDISFVPKVISLLSADSPFFDAFWPLVFDGADTKTKQNLELTSSYFRRLAKREKARQLSENIKAKYRHSIEINSVVDVPPNPLKLDPLSDTPLWYKFSATYAFFPSVEMFEAFCRLVDVDPTAGVDWHQYKTNALPSTSFLSSMGDVHITCIPDPDLMGNDGSWTRYLGCIGEREKVLEMESWFSKNCNCFQLMRGEDIYR